MGQPTERDNAPEPNTSGKVDAPNPGTVDEDVPYVPPVKAYERPEVGHRPTTSTGSGAAPTLALPTVVGHVALPKPPVASPPAAGPAVPASSATPAAEQTAQISVTRPTPPLPPVAQPTTQLPPVAQPTTQLPPVAQQTSPFAPGGGQPPAVAPGQPFAAVPLGTVPAPSAGGPGG